MSMFANFQLTNNPDVVKGLNEQGQIMGWIPRGNSYWIEEYEPWLAAGNTPLPSTDPPEISGPSSVEEPVDPADPLTP